MKIVITEVINDTNGEYVLKQYIQGAYITLEKIQGNGGTYKIKCDPRGTSCSFWVGTGRAGDETSIDSGQCVDISKIVVRNSSPGGKAVTQKIRRDGVGWTEVLNKTGNECNITRSNANEDNYTSIGQLRENGSLFILSDDPDDATKFSKYRLEVDGRTELKIDISVEDCVRNQNINIMIKEGDPSGQMLVKKTRKRATAATATDSTVAVSSSSSQKKSFWKTINPFKCLS